MSRHGSHLIDQRVEYVGDAGDLHSTTLCSVGVTSLTKEWSMLVILVTYILLLCVLWVSLV